MTDGQPALIGLVRAIAAGDAVAASKLLATTPALAVASVAVGATRTGAESYFLDRIRHYVYAGDTALHIAGAAYRADIAGELIAAGADVGARNRRGATPLHYTADGAPDSAHWDPSAQSATISYLIDAGADPNARDRSGVTPLHRAVRTRCADAVTALLDGGADPHLTNGNGSTPLKLATRPTGRGGSGLPPAQSQQQQIVRELHDRGAIS